MVCEITLSIQIDDHFGPLGELRLIINHNVGVVGNDLGALALQDHDFLSVDEARVMNWHYERRIYILIKISYN